MRLCRTTRRDPRMEDHAAGEWRYACMSRPYVSTIEQPKPEDITGYKPMRDSVKPGDWVTY